MQTFEDIAFCNLMKRNGGIGSPMHATADNVTLGMRVVLTRRASAITGAPLQDPSSRFSMAKDAQINNR